MNYGKYFFKNIRNGLNPKIFKELKKNVKNVNK